MRKINSTFQTNFISEEGSKLINKDYFAFVELDKLACYVLVDGIDEDIDKQSGQIIAESIIRSFTERPTLKKRRLKNYIKKAHHLLQSESREMRLKASAIVIVTDYVKYRYINIGNTRFYLMRNGRILKKTEDQSLTQLLVNEDKISQDKIAEHEQRHNLYNYLGQDELLQPDISKKFKLEDGDIWLLLTRGIWEYCDEGELIDAVDEAKKPQEVIDNVEELVLSKQPQEIDNYTLAVTFVDKIYKNPKPKMSFKKIMMIALPILLVSAILGTTFYFKHRAKKQKVAEFQDYKISAEKYVLHNNYLRANEDYSEALKLAKKLKKQQDKETLERYIKLIEQILLADDQLQQGEYSEAQAAYLIAQNLSYEADLIGKDYIIDQLNKVKKHLDVLDLLQEGDKRLDYGEVDLARAAYQDAKTLANENYFQEAKKEAIEKIDKIDSQKAQDKKEQAEETKKEEEAQKEEEEAKKEEEEQAEEERKKILETKLSALEIEKKGNVSYDIGSYEDAKMYYLMAKEMYLEIGLFEKTEGLDKKMLLTDKKIAMMQSKKLKADTYVQDADEKVGSQEYIEARMLYLIAKDLYEEAGLQEAAHKVDNKITQLDELLG